MASFGFLEDKTEVRNYHFSKVVKIDKKEIFELMANLEKYPSILPHNVKSIKILNQTDNVIYAEETLSESGFNMEFIVKHEIIPFEYHSLEIISGNAKGSKITLNFVENDGNTIIDSYLEIHFSGYLKFLMLPLTERNIESAFNSVISSFESFLKNNQQ